MTVRNVTVHIEVPTVSSSGVSSDDDAGLLLIARAESLSYCNVRDASAGAAGGAMAYATTLPKPAGGGANGGAASISDNVSKRFDVQGLIVELWQLREWHSHAASGTPSPTQHPAPGGKAEGQQGLVDFLAKLFDGAQAAGGSPPDPVTPVRGADPPAGSRGSGRPNPGAADSPRSGCNTNLILSSPEGTGLRMTLQLRLMQGAQSGEQLPATSHASPQPAAPDIPPNPQRDVQADIQLSACQVGLAPHMLPRIAALHQSVAGHSARRGSTAVPEANSGHGSIPVPQSRGVPRTGAAGEDRRSAPTEDDQWAQRSFVDGLFFPDCKNLVADTLGSQHLAAPAAAPPPPHLQQRWHVTASAPEFIIKLLYPEAIADIACAAAFCGEGAGASPNAGANGRHAKPGTDACSYGESVKSACIRGVGIGGVSGLLLTFGGVQMTLALMGRSECSFDLVATDLEVIRFPAPY